MEIIYDCCDDPKIHVGLGYVTLAYYPPILDKYGHNTNPDRNVTTTVAKCLSCGKDWTTQK